MGKDKVQPTQFAKNLAKLLKDRGLSTRDAALMCGVSQSTLSEWLQGRNPTQLDKVAKLARATNVSFEWLLVGTSENKSIDSIPLSELFEEAKEPSMEGIFKISVVKLTRK